jgi:hypothetical protein
LLARGSVCGVVASGLSCAVTSVKRDDESPVQSFERASAAFDGAPIERGSGADRKMFTIVASGHGAHTRITPGGLSVLWPHRRQPFTYWPSLGPGVVETLRLHAPERSFARPFEIDEATLARLAFARRGATWFWVSRTTEAIVIDSRPALPGHEPPSTPDPLEPWRPAEKVFLRFEPPRSCVHCAGAPERYRLTEDALVCLACGRSQSVTSLELAHAIVDPQPRSSNRA